MLALFRIIGLVVLVFNACIVYGQEEDLKPVTSTSATDPKVKIHTGRRIVNEAGATEHTSQRLKKHKASAGTGSPKEARTFRRHRHFADRDIKMRSRSKVSRKESLGVGTE